MTRIFDTNFDLRQNKRLGKQSRHRWFETPLHSLWHHCNVTGVCGAALMVCLNKILLFNFICDNRAVRWKVSLDMLPQSISKFGLQYYIFNGGHEVVRSCGSYMNLRHILLRRNIVCHFECFQLTVPRYINNFRTFGKTMSNWLYSISQECIWKGYPESTCSNYKQPHVTEHSCLSFCHFFVQ